MPNHLSMFVLTLHEIALTYMRNIYSARIGEVITHKHTSSEHSVLCSNVCGQLTVGVAGSAHFLED